MRRLVFVLAVWGLTTDVVAERNPIYDNWLTPERLVRWQELSQNMTYVDLYTLIEEMFYLEEKPWGEPEKQILLKMTETMIQLRQDRLEGRPVIVPEHVVASMKDEPVDLLLDTMVSWQDDPRFIKFQSTYEGQGLSARGLARIGEPAFATVMESFNRKPPPIEAIRTLENMIKKEDSFLLHNTDKRRTAQTALFKVLKSEGTTARLWAVDALRHFPDRAVFLELETISLNDSWVDGNGHYPLRSRAQEALKFMRANGNGF